MSVILYEHINFQGRHKHVVNRDEASLHPDGWGDRVSSIEVLDGTWAFYQHANFAGAVRVLGPGSYNWVQSIGMANDSLSSLRRIDGGSSDTAVGGIILFEHANYQGAHIHLFDRDDANLHTTGWGDRVSSAIVVGGEWDVFQHTNYRGWSRTLGPGMYPRLWESGVGNDSLSSIRRRIRPNLGGSLETREALLYEHIDYRGDHRHLVNGGSANLHADGWGDRVSSAQVLGGANWTFHQHVNYQGQQVALGVGNTSFLPNAGFPNDQLSSVRANIVPLAVVEIEGAAPQIQRDFQQANAVFGAAGFELVNIRAVEVEALAVLDLDQPACNNIPQPNPTDEEDALFRFGRDFAPSNPITYYVRSTSLALRGCGTYPAGLPGVVVTDVETQWTMGHEIGHLLGLNHRNNTTHLMNNATAGITINPPILTANDQNTIRASGFLI